MLIVLGIYIPLSGDVKIKHTHCFTTMGILGLLAIVTLYINSMFAYPVYEAGKLIAVEYVPNFFFTYETPIGIALTEKWHWYLYIVILLALATFFCVVFYLPYFIKEYKRRKQEKQ